MQYGYDENDNNNMSNETKRETNYSTRVVQKTVDTRVARETPTFSSSGAGTIRTFLDSMPDGILLVFADKWDDCL